MATKFFTNKDNNIDKVDASTGRTLNPAAHFNEEPFFKDEMEEALKTIDELRKAV